MASPSLLVGPPELHLASGKQYLDSTVHFWSKFNKFTNFNVNTKPLPPSLPPKTARTRTENGSGTFTSSDNPCLDFFFHVVPDTPKDSLVQRLHAAWNHDALTTLKLICNLRGVRGTGRSDKEGFYTAALWLHGNHPKTLACNLEPLSNFGYFKDYPELLYRILQGSEIRTIQKSKWIKRKLGSRPSFSFDSSSYFSRRIGLRGRGRGCRGRGRGVGSSGRTNLGLGGRGGVRGRGSRGMRLAAIRAERAPTREQRIANGEKKNQEEKAKASLNRKMEKLSMGQKAFTRYSHDQDYRLLFDRVSDLFAEHLKKDLEFLTSNEPNKISLASKWCPSLDSSFDKATLLCESIAKRIFPRVPEYKGVEEGHYAYRVRDRLRKQVLVPLRKALQLPEVYIGSNDWGSLRYERVASVAMGKYKEIFLNHDEERFQEFLDDVKVGKKKIAAGALLPHWIIRELEGGRDGGLVAELQWKRMVNDLKKKGSLTNCIAISDVSGSMAGEPMEVSIALGLLVSELSQEPWKGKIITFSHNPELHFVQGKNLKAKTSFVKKMEWGMNTDFQKVFDLILKVAVDGKVKPVDMIKKVFVFSDMEFDQASCSARNSWETDYEAIVRKYKEKGYGEVVPQIVFWNLRDSRSTPVMGTQKGVALVSGFSKNLLKMFLDNDGEISPMKIMEDVISGEEYSKLVVFD